MSEAFPPAGGRALEVASMAAASTGVDSMVVVDDIGDRMYPHVNSEKFRNGGKTVCCRGFRFLINLNGRVLVDLLHPFYSHFPWGVGLCQRSPSSRDNGLLAPPKMPGVLSLLPCRQRT